MGISATRHSSAYIRCHAAADEHQRAAPEYELQLGRHARCLQRRTGMIVASTKQPQDGTWVAVIILRGQHLTHC